MSDVSVSTKRRVLVVTVGRSDYGIYRPVIEAMEHHSSLTCQLLVSGAHLGEGGETTLREIELEGRNIVARIPLPPSNGSAASMSEAMAVAVMEGAKVLAQLRPDFVLVLGDRFEMFGFASAAVPFNIPIAHIHGGELTFGAIDDVFRHAITKMAHLHFAATENYARRIRQLGEEDWRIHVSGAPALDTILNCPLPDRASLQKRFGLRLDRPPILVTYHPVTRSADDSAKQLIELLEVLMDTGEPIIITAPNADAGADRLRAIIGNFVNHNPSISFVESFGAEYYLALLREALCVVGNSSSGIIETPSFAVPTINIGDRQAGRTRSANIIDVPAERAAIVKAIKHALSPAFRAGLAGLTSPYGDGRAGERIAHVLATVSLDRSLIVKRFADLP